MRCGLLVEAAVEASAAQLTTLGEQAEQLAMAVGEVFRDPPKVALAGRATLLEALQAGIAEMLAVLRTRTSLAPGSCRWSCWGCRAGHLLTAETLAGHLVREIMARGAGGGPLAPLADQAEP